MNTNNALGYLVGALRAARAIVRWGSGATILSGGIACLNSLILCAVLKDTVLLNSARVLAELGGDLLLSQVVCWQPACLLETPIGHLFYSGFSMPV